MKDVTPSPFVAAATMKMYNRNKKEATMWLLAKGSALPYHAILVTALFIIYSFLVRYIPPRCVVDEDEMADTSAEMENPCGTEGVDNSVYAWATDFFLAITFFILAIHLYMTLSVRKNVVASAFVSLSLAFLFHGFAIRFFGNTTAGDGKGMWQFYLLTFFQYILWTASAVLFGFLVQLSWYMLDDEGRKCGIMESRIILVINILSALAVVTGSLWSAGAWSNMVDHVADGYGNDTTQSSVPSEIFKISQLLWQASYCAFLITSSYVWGALAKQEPQRLGGLLNTNAATGIVLAQVVVACLVVYYTVAGGNGPLGWRVDDGNSVSTAFYNYAMLMTGFFSHQLFASFFLTNDLLKKKENDLEAATKNDIGEDTDEVSDDDASEDINGHTDDNSSVSTKLGESLSKSTSASRGFIFSILPFLRREKDSIQEQIEEFDISRYATMEGPGGAKTVVIDEDPVDEKMETSPDSSIEEANSIDGGPLQHETTNNVDDTFRVFEATTFALQDTTFACAPLRVKVDDFDDEMSRWSSSSPLPAPSTMVPRNVRQTNFILSYPEEKTNNATDLTGAIIEDDTWTKSDGEQPENEIPANEEQTSTTWTWGTFLGMTNEADTNRTLEKHVSECANQKKVMKLANESEDPKAKVTTWNPEGWLFSGFAPLIQSNNEKDIVDAKASEEPDIECGEVSKDAPITAAASSLLQPKVTDQSPVVTEESHVVTEESHVVTEESYVDDPAEAMDIHAVDEEHYSNNCDLNAASDYEHLEIECLYDYGDGEQDGLDPEAAFGSFESIDDQPSETVNQQPTEAVVAVEDVPKNELELKTASELEDSQRSSRTAVVDNRSTEACVGRQEWAGGALRRALKLRRKKDKKDEKA